MPTPCQAFQALPQRNTRRVVARCVAALATLLGATACQGQTVQLPGNAQALVDSQSAWQPNPQQRVALTVNTHVVHQPLSWQPRGGSPELQASPSTQSTLGLEFRRKSSTQSAKDLLKVQLTADSALNFKPRGGGMVVTYRSQF